MKRAERYLIIQTKRVLRCFPAVFLMTLILLAAVGLVGKGVIQEKLSDDKKSMVKIGVVGDVTDSYLGIGVMALQHLDSSRFSIDIQMMEEETAKKALKTGDLSAYLVIPAGFVDSVVSGENFKITYYTKNSQMGIGTMLMNELSAIISDFITKSQNAIYGMQSLCREYGYDDIYWDATNELNLKYIDMILARTDFFDVEVLGVANQLSMVGYYISGLTVFFLMIWGVNGCPLFIRRDLSLAKMLKTNGMGPFPQIICEYIAYLLLMTVSLVVIFALLGGVCEITEFSVPEWGRAELSKVMAFGVSLIPVACMLTAMALCLHELTENLISGMLLQFLVSVSMGYVSGCFYPNTFFPVVIQKIGQFLPSGVAIEYASQSLRGEIGVGICLALAGYMILFVAAVYLLRFRKLEKN